MKINAFSDFFTAPGWEGWTAIGTLTAAIVPLIFFFAERKSRIDTEKRVELSENRQLILNREVQARRIVLVTSYDHANNKKTTRPYITNYSDAPCFNLKVEIFEESEDRCSISARVIRNTKVLRPGETEQFVYKVEVPNSTAKATHGIRIRFTDVHRREWITYDSGRMKLIYDVIDEKLGTISEDEDVPSPF